MQVLKDFEIQQVSGGDWWSDFRDSVTRDFVTSTLNWIYPNAGALFGRQVWQGLSDALSTSSSSGHSGGGIGSGGSQRLKP